MNMTFLIKLWKRLSNLLHNDDRNESRIIIPTEIDGNEVIVRGIFHPFHWSKSKNRLKREAFLPPEGEKDVSTLRLEYTNEDFCKKHVKKIAKEVDAYTYCGLATFLADSIENTNKEISKNELNTDIYIQLVFSPMDNKKQYRSDSPIYTSDIGLPMHSDILYSEKVPERGKPQTRFRIVADILIKKVSMYVDEFPEEDEWTGPPLSN